MVMKHYWIFLLPLLFLNAKCDKGESQIPYRAVDFEINLNLPAYQDLVVPTGWLYVSGGSRGILIYRHTQDSFVAMDRHATYSVNDNCRVEVLEDNITVEDPCSGSTWLIIDGSVMSGPATFPLQQYSTTWNPPVLRVYN
jgi:hypothetical protein